MQGCEALVGAGTRQDARRWRERRDAVIEGTYVSGDACERADAFRFGYRTVCHHPKEVGVLGPEQVLVIDFDHVLFDDRDLAVRKANEAAHRGVFVGVHTYYPTDPRLQRFLALPNVHVAKTHRRLLVVMRRRMRAKVTSRRPRAATPHLGMASRLISIQARNEPTSVSDPALLPAPGVR